MLDTRPLASLRGNRKFAFLWSSNLFFFAGAWSQTLVLAWVVFDTTHSDLLVAIFTSARLAPMLLGPFSGAFADRHNRARLLLIACTWAMIAVSAVATLMTLGHAPYWVLLVGGFGIGLAQSPSQPARASLVLELVGRDNLSNANALNSLAMNMTQVVGPALGGVMISTLGASVALWVSTTWYAISLILLLPLRGLGQAHGHEHAESVMRMVVSGFRAVIGNRLASAVLFVTVAANIFLWPIYQAFMPVFAKESLRLDATGLGLLLTCGGVGGLVGSLVIASLGDFRYKGGLFVFGTAAWSALWAMFALSHSVAASFVLMGGIGLASAAFGVLQTTLLLMIVEPSMHGRALGLQELAIGVMPIASLGLGAAAESFGVGPTTFVSASVLGVIMLVLAVVMPRLIRYGGQPAAPDQPSPATEELLSAAAAVPRAADW
jgi:MFS family permease